jgi:hypothetical protein
MAYTCCDGRCLRLSRSNFATGYCIEIRLQPWFSASYCIFSPNLSLDLPVATCGILSKAAIPLCEKFHII